MEHVVNWELISNPFNWIIVFIVLYLVALIAHLLFTASATAPIQLPSGIGL
jgi:hypothetical protein